MMHRKPTLNGDDGSCPDFRVGRDYISQRFQHSTTN